MDLRDAPASHVIGHALHRLRPRARSSSARTATYTRWTTASTPTARLRRGFLKTGAAELPNGQQNIEISGLAIDMERQTGTITAQVTTYDRSPAALDPGLDQDSGTFGAADSMVDLRVQAASRNCGSPAAAHSATISALACLKSCLALEGHADETASRCPRRRALRPPMSKSVNGSWTASKTSVDASRQEDLAIADPYTVNNPPAASRT